MNAWNIIGHDWAIHRLSQQIEHGELAQSHLFIGPPSVGKAALARALVREVLSYRSVDVSRAKKLVEQQKHPDFSWVGLGDSDSSIKIDQIRSLIHTLTLAPVEGRYRVAVVDDMHLATDSSQNAILKTLEEPNPSSIIILIAPSTDGLLPTIVSRCQVLNLRGVPVHVLVDGLVQRGIDRERATFLARLARGRPGWAIRANADTQLLEQRAQRLGDLVSLLSTNRTGRFHFVEALVKSQGDEIEQVLDEWLSYWRDVVCIGNGTPVEATIQNVDHMETITQLASQVSMNESVTMVRGISNAIRYLQQNARPQLVLDALMIQMPHL